MVKHEVGLGAEAAGGVGGRGRGGGGADGSRVEWNGGGVEGTGDRTRKKRSGWLGFAKARASLFFSLVLCLPTQFQAREIRVGVQL